MFFIDVQVLYSFDPVLRRRGALHMPDTSELPPRRWNLFARELENILAQRGCRLGQIDDRTPVNREKVARLQRSLTEPKFHVLSPTDLEYVYEAFDFTSEERTRIRAAILATAIEKMLKDRVDVEDALVAAEQIFPILVRVLRTYEGRQKGMGAVKDSPSRWVKDDMAAMTHLFESALDYYDQGMLELHLSQGAHMIDDQIVHARQAQSIFIAALARLEETDTATKNMPSWIVWYDEIQKGLATVTTRLQTLSL
jgi:hypothetical protein